MIALIFDFCQVDTDNLEADVQLVKMELARQKI